MNASSTTSHKKTKSLRLWEFSFFLSCTFIHDPILIVYLVFKSNIKKLTHNKYLRFKPFKDTCKLIKVNSINLQYHGANCIFAYF